MAHIYGDLCLPEHAKHCMVFWGDGHIIKLALFFYGSPLKALCFQVCPFLVNTIFYEKNKVFITNSQNTRLVTDVQKVILAVKCSFN